MLHKSFTKKETRIFVEPRTFGQFLLYYFVFWNGGLFIC